MLRDLLTTWETWSARDTLARALSNASTDQARETLTRSLAEMPKVDPLDALQDTTKLVALLQGWQWQVVHEARAAGASWHDVAIATDLSPERAQAAYEGAIAKARQSSRV